jgi:predicted transposase YbfD/YdcC
VEVVVIRNGAKNMDRRLFISSLPPDALEELASAARAHWGIEAMHWILDVAFREDECRIRAGHAAEKLGALRKLALNMLRQNPRKLGIENQRLCAAWNHRYLLGLLGLDF